MSGIPLTLAGNVLLNERVHASNCADYENHSETTEGVYEHMYRDRDLHICD